MKKIDMDTIYIKKGYKYQTSRDYTIKLHINPYVKFENEFFEITADGWLWIKKGYAYDGASGPTIDTANSYRGAAIHDALYQLMRMGIIPQSYRKSADLVMYKCLREDGMWYIRAKAWYGGLRVGAAKHARPSASKKEYSYPK